MRTAVLWTGFAAFLAALAVAGEERPPASPTALAVAGALLAAVTASGCLTARLLAALRKGQVVVGIDGPPWRPGRRVIAAAFVALGLAAAVARAAAGLVTTPWGPLLAGAWTGVVVALLLPLPPRAAAQTKRLARWWLGGALWAGLLAAVVGGVVGVVRFAGADGVPPGALARLLAGTSLTYTLLGLGGFHKAFAEHKTGVVVVDAEPFAGTPGPFFVGLVIAAALAVVGPWVLPALSGGAVVAVKVVFGALCGAALHLLGAMAGHRVSAWGRGGAPPPPSSPG